MARHNFAVFVDNLKDTITDQVWNSVDRELCRRVVKILRLKAGDWLTIFDGNQQAFVQLSQVTSKAIVGSVKEFNVVQELTPYITYCLPLLKKDSLEKAIYSLAELGVNRIVPFTSSKTHTLAEQALRYDRLKKILIAACEQAKQLCLPEIAPVMSFDQLLSSEALQGASHKIYFDGAGEPVTGLINRLDCSDSICLMSGPEADLSEEEKVSIKKSDFSFTRLTPTVLRAHQAVTIGLGVVRSVLSCTVALAAE
ncbi:16S rRNA (uracil(1498)-N(3))-methyltransferase [bacterium]|jgi:16S rRNA (uracil1498-N3)-methyltransferase|nr:16S rRNA (uracil(1498)-N(3))-methyltransferase [bacterium]MBT3903849.1 16S rRNA (uracil(1498)-N(3))-methyltransferase [bacterium]MBT4577713.1 16S rRNA (uracil(1498)-N(3))-methyltransferase [bacterium]MBT5345607.1 16S rRNA (uracil(1498)-N(3))-methyltransferase [bacterium]MBT6130706.1 16S rRNA (uracil(1498)-N(3))-methyltransferase [bacterium]